jgi:hypothetical protein
VEQAVGIHQRLAILGDALGQEVAPVRRGDDQRVPGPRLEAALELRLEQLPARVALLEGEIVADHAEALAPAAQQGPERRQLEQILAPDLDQPEALGAELAEQTAHGRRLPGAALAVEEHVERGLAARERRHGHAQLLDRALDAEQAVERIDVRVGDRLQRAASPAERERLLRVRARGSGVRARERVLEPFEHALDARQEIVPAPGHVRSRAIALRASGGCASHRRAARPGRSGSRRAGFPHRRSGSSSARSR